MWCCVTRGGVRGREVGERVGGGRRAGGRGRLKQINPSRFLLIKEQATIWFLPFYGLVVCCWVRWGEG